VPFWKLEATIPPITLLSFWGTLCDRKMALYCGHWLGLCLIYIQTCTFGDWGGEILFTVVFTLQGLCKFRLCKAGYALSRLAYNWYVFNVRKLGRRQVQASTRASPWATPNTSTPTPTLDIDFGLRRSQHQDIETISDSWLNIGTQPIFIYSILHVRDLSVYSIHTFEECVSLYGFTVWGCWYKFRAQITDAR
jgi:hypothetical protein